MIALSPEQQKIVDAPLAPLIVIACAGSGKTQTAVRRLLELRRKLGDSRGHATLLSFSNVAVQTFRSDYLALLQQLPGSVGKTRTTIETADSFITTNILRPHAHRTMGSGRVPFLISGAEPFLQNQKFQFWASPKTGNKFPITADQVGVSLIEGQPVFFWLPRGGGTPLPINNGLYAAEQLGTVGAYTHEIGRYWVYRTLLEQPSVLRALAHRYPFILVDEAQDIGAIHRAILELLVAAGVQVSLIGDPDQAIYEFAGADGSFLSEYATKAGATPLPLTTNYRSVPAILFAANAIAQRSATAYRAAPASRHGAFFVPYAQPKMLELIESFKSTVLAAGLDLSRSAAVCRSRPLTQKLLGTDSEHGQGVIKAFVAASILRDTQSNYHESFKIAAGCLVALLSNAPEGLLSRLLNTGHDQEMRHLRRMIWTFVRNSDTGLPLASLAASTEWHPRLVARVKTLLESVQSRFGLQYVDNLGQKLAKKKLPSTAIANLSIAAKQDSSIRIDTVHQVKGESLDAVLYVATKPHVQALLDGVGSEDGRIGYVALTRARDLFWLGVPENNLAELKGPLLACGFKEWVEN
ncbi:MAG: ATP-dependent helicase [Nitrospira sp.]|nr:ATP-dependent helicase [Nitrospira sp.]